MVYAKYNMTEFEASRNLIEAFAATNALSGEWLVNLGLIVFGAVMLAVLSYRNPMPESFVAATGTVTILSLMLLAVKVSTGVSLTSLPWVVGFTLLFALSAVGLYLRNKTT